MNRAVKLGTYSSEDTALRHRIFDTLAGPYLQLLPTHQLRSVADCTIPLYACAKAGYWRGGFVQALLERLSLGGLALLKSALTPQDRHKVSDQNHANLWWSLSVAPPEVRSAAPLQTVLEASAEGLIASRDLSSQAIANVLLACARLKWGNNALLTHLTACLVEARDRADCQALANSLYALGELAEDVGHTPRAEDLQGLGRAVLQQLLPSNNWDGFIPQALSNMFLGCTKLGYRDPSFLSALTAAAVKAAARMIPQDLANSLYSLALLQPSVSVHGGAVEALAEECKRRRFTGFTSQDLANTAWALAKMGFEDQMWYAATVEAAGQPGAMQGATPQGWCNVWYALALARHRPVSGRLLERTAEAAGLLRQVAKAQDCTNLLWALANLRLYDERLVDALAGRLGKLLGQDPKQLTSQEVSTSLWALALMGPDVLSRHSGLVEGLLREAERRWVLQGGQATAEENLVQLWQTHLELAHVGGGELHRILGAGEGRQGSLLAAMRARAVARAEKMASLKPTLMEAEVVSALEQLQQRMGPGAIVSVQRRCVVEEVGRYAEAVVDLAGGRHVAVDTVGRSDVYANAPNERTPLGPPAFSMRQLDRNFGEDGCVAVPYWEWEGVKGKGEQERYLRRKLGLGQA